MGVVRLEFPLDEVDPLLAAARAYRPRSKPLDKAIRELERASSKAREAEAAQLRRDRAARDKRTARIPEAPLTPQSMSRRRPAEA